MDHRVPVLVQHPDDSVAGGVSASGNETQTKKRRCCRGDLNLWNFTGWFLTEIPLSHEDLEWITLMGTLGHDLEWISSL